MSPEVLGLVMISLMVVSIMIGFPTAFTLMSLGVTFGFLGIGFVVFDLVVQRTFFVMQNDVLVAIPLFLFMGYLIERAGILDELFHAVQAMFGWLPGSFAAGAIAASGTLGILIPPSVLLILYGFVAGVSVPRLYAGAFLPGFALSGLYLGYIIARAKFRPQDAPMMPKELREKLDAAKMFRLILRGFVPITALILFVMGAIFLGFATPSEGAALGALGGLLLAALHKRLSFPMVKESVFLTVRTSAMVGWLLVGSSIFAAVFARLGSAQIIGNWVLGFNLGPEAFFWVAQFLIFVLGWPLEWTEITIIFMPLFLPLLAQYHTKFPDNISTDAFFFGIMAALNQQTSFLSPPVAMSAFYLKGVVGKAITLNQIFTGMYPFMAIQIVAMIVLWLAPWLAYGPANLVYGA